MKITIPPIYEENIIEFVHRNGDVVLKYLSEEKPVQIFFFSVYAFDFVEFDYIKETGWQFGLELPEDSAYIHNMVKGMSQEKIRRAFGGEFEKLQHYRLVIDDVGIYNMVCKGIKILSTAYNITFAPGLTSDEISSIELRYNIHFPKSLRDFLMQALPVSEGFYNWRDSSAENIRYIKEAIARPIEMLKEVAGEVELCKEWSKAPVLIPVYAHRYMPMVEEENPPILSVHGTDIIYYGENLLDYLDVEFGTKKQTDIAFDRIQPVPFWSEIMEK